MLTHEEVQSLKKEIFKEADERYVMADDCIERQESINKMLANDDKRIELISHDFNVIKKLMWVIASASAGSLGTTLVELFLKG
jgi:hypothetical protein